MIIDAYRFGGGGSGGELLPVSFAQSTVYGGLAATTANMRDADFTTGAATDNPGGLEWIRADLGSPQVVTSLEFAGGNLPGWGGVALYLNTKGDVEYSNDASSWTSLGLVTGASDSSPFITTFPVASISARYWRISYLGYLATTEFRLYG